jgi:NAD(P)-dependent dehydrogenase (short-subunit alcohol dehydrogenase family)
MVENKENILVTGGTSGLGLELVRLLLSEGYYVTATGRQEPVIHDNTERFRFCRVDFASLDNVAQTFRKLRGEINFEVIINNAGILSSPDFIQTIDNIEYTFQVNFLAHLLINEILISDMPCKSRLRIITVTSPVNRIARIKSYQTSDERNYSPVQAYSASKLYLTMMHDILAVRHADEIPLCCSFDPGTFSSGIYRMQKRWFREMYHVAAPFMRSPAKVARALAKLIESDDIQSGAIYDISCRRKQLPVVEQDEKDKFITLCYSLIEKFIHQN